MNNIPAKLWYIISFFIITVICLLLYIIVIQKECITIGEQKYGIICEKIMNKELPISTVVCNLSCTSANKKFKAEKNGNHYKIIEIETNRIIKTRGQFSENNNVKAGVFSSTNNHTNFGVAYHYGHKGNYTWIGIWD